MGHPMENYYDGRRRELDRLWDWRDRVEARVAKISLAEFTASQLPDLQLLFDRSAVSKNEYDLRKALERLEGFLAKRKQRKR